MSDKSPPTDKTNYSESNPANQQETILEESVNKSPQSDKPRGAANDKLDSAPWGKTEWFNFFSLSFSALVVIIYATQAYYMRQQWTEMQGTGQQTNELIKAANIQAENTKKLAIAAIGQVEQLTTTAKAAQASAEAARAAVVAESPLLVIVDHKISSRPDEGALRISYTLTNFGRGHAIIDKAAARLIALEKLPLVDDFTLAKTLNMKPILRAGESENLIATNSNPNLRSEIDIIRNRIIVIFFGHFVYRDRFSQRYESTFLYQLDPRGHDPVSEWYGTADSAQPGPYLMQGPKEYNQYKKLKS